MDHRWRKVRWSACFLACIGALVAPVSSLAPIPSPPSSRVAMVVYDAGETLALLPVAARLESAGIEVEWIPLTPWAADLLARNAQPFLSLPASVGDMPHSKDRRGDSEIDYWDTALARPPPDLVILGMVSTIQGRIAARLQEVGIPTRGSYDGFQPPGPESIVVEVASSYDEIWVSTARVRDGFDALGIDVVVGGQPTLEAWRRASVEVDTLDVRRRLGAETHQRILTYAGQYGSGYEEVLASFLSAMREPLASDSSLLLVLSHHPRTDGSVEREALLRAGLDRAVMVAEGLSTMELATASDVILTWASTVGVQAAFMGKEVIYYLPPENFDAYLVDQSAASLADEVTLGGLLSRALASPRSPDAIRTILVGAGYVVDADQVVAEMIERVVGG